MEQCKVIRQYTRVTNPLSRPNYQIPSYKNVKVLCPYPHLFDKYKDNPHVLCREQYA